uniref:Putative SET and MYND domain-containing protein 4 isoform X1 n=1 Tax=Davidia involucrata TaxID=16924 RepID=A0A5B7BBN2_DAVIN
MEKLKSVVPKALKRLITETTPDDLPSSSSSLLDFFLQLPQFHQIVRDLTDPETALCRKNKDAALESKRKGNECFSNGDYPKALNLYSQALRVAPSDADDMDKNLTAMLYVNRASVLHKMGLLEECRRDCNRALVIYPSYAKAWYRRGKANASLENYEDAVCDLNVSMNMEMSLGGKRQIESELKLLLHQYKGTSSSLDKANENNTAFLNEPHQIELHCVSTPTKGRGMASLTDIPQASLIHIEEPYAAIILKHCRDTHCHFCLNELPADTVPCSSCSIPLYCSQQCQIQAGGQKLGKISKNYGIHEKFSGDLEKYIADIMLANVSGSNIECIAEHRHECQGVHWPAILPSEIVLAGRVLVKSIQQQRHYKDVSNLMGTLDLSHNYVQLPPESKLEFHIYSIILLYCLQHSHGSEFPINGVTVSQIVILLSQIKVNSMAIVRMNFLDVYGPLTQSGKFSPAGNALTSNVEQVRVGQAIYSAGSLFNHSCQPNIHAYFLSRTLYIRSTEFVVAGHPLELSYGPQVGQWDCKDRQQFLEDQYSFRCQCSGCSKMNLSDLVLNAFRCVKPNCFGVVLDSCGAKHEKQKINHFLGSPPICSLEPHMQVDKLKSDDINKVARHVFEEIGHTHQIELGYCLNCGSYRDLEASHATVNEAGIYIRRLQDAIVSNEVQANTLSDALRSLDLLRSTLHAYHKKIAEVEDNLAHAFCMVGKLQPAMDHCKASIEILEKLYDPNHIVIGNELVKLSSIQRTLDECTAKETINRVAAIVSRYYGSQADMIFPYLQSLKREAHKLPQ